MNTARRQQLNEEALLDADLLLDNLISVKNYSLDKPS